MAWTFEEIERIWLRGQALSLPAEDVVRAFNAAEEARGRDWVLGSVYLPGGHEQWGIGPLWRVYSFGLRMPSLAGAPGTAGLAAKLRQLDPSADAELAAIHILRSPDMRRALELEPEVQVGGRVRRPDFRIRDGDGPWVYVEVTKLNRSTAAQRAQTLIGRIAEAVIAVERQFLIEVVVDRELTAAEEDDLVRRALSLCEARPGERDRVGDYALVIAKAGDPATIEPTVLPDDAVPRAAAARTVGGPGGQARQIMVRMAFSDQRAEDILTAEARQLPSGECGLVMVDVSWEVTAFDSWPRLIPRRFTPAQHTRVAGVLLFGEAVWATAEGPQHVTSVTLLPNRHARVPLPAWVVERVENMRAENRRRTGQPA